jgi:hypothetical protein
MLVESLDHMCCCVSRHVPAGLLKAITTAATAAARLIRTKTPQLPHSDPNQSAEQALLQVMDNPLHVFAAASNSLLVLWDTVADLTPIAELLPARSPLLGSAVPAASLAMALARAYAADKAFCGPVTYHVLSASLMFARASVSGPHDKHYSTLAHRDVYELLLLGLAVGTGLLHAEYKGKSKQSLLRSMQAAGSSSSSSTGRSSGSMSRRLAVSAHHKELLHALLGVRQLAAVEEVTVPTLSFMMWLVPHAVCEAGRTRLNEATASHKGPGSIWDVEVVPGPLVLPLLLTQVELLALAPPFLTEKLPILQQVLAIMSGSFEELRTWTRAQPWQQQQQQQGNSPNTPSLRTVQSQLQLCVQAVWLQLGPALLALCRRSSGEAAGEDDGDVPGCCLVSTGSGQVLGDVLPRQVYATFSEMLMAVMTWQGEWAGPRVPG